MSLNGHNLSIAQQSGATIITHNVPTDETYATPRHGSFNDGDWSQPVTVGPDHPIYKNATPLSYNPQQDPDMNPAEGFVTKNGSTQGDLTDINNSLLRLNGMEISIDVAKKHGLVTVDGSGMKLTDKAKGMMNVTTASANKQQQQQQDVTTHHIADTKARSAGLTRLEQAVGTSAVHNMIQTTLSALSRGERPKDFTGMENAAKAAGMSSKQVVETISNAVQGSEIRAKGALKRAGINPESVFSHLYNNVDANTRVSILSGLISGDVSALNYAVKLAQTGDKR